MTLLLGMANEQYAALISDRRITRAGHVVNDEFTKLSILICHDARLAIGFTGLAEYESFSTEEWLVDTLHELGKGTLTADQVFSELVRLGNTTFQKLPREHNQAAFLFCGFRYEDSGPCPVVYQVENQGPERSFRVHQVPRDGGIALSILGATAGVDKRSVDTLTKVLASPASSREMIRTGISVIGRAAQDARSRRLIGAQCNTAIIPREVDTTITSTYHSSAPTGVAYGPNVIFADGLFAKGVTVKTSEIMSGPVIRKNAPCWCRSGRRFKDCHLKQFGNIYVNAPPFREPMFPFFKSTFDEPRPSGRICHVLCAFT